MVETAINGDNRKIIIKGVKTIPSVILVLMNVSYIIIQNIVKVLPVKNLH